MPSIPHLPVLAALVALALPALPAAAEPAAAKGAARAAPKGAPSAKAEPASPGVKAGDTVYVCACGEQCSCKTIQATPGKCSCGQPLVKATVARVEGDQIVVAREGAPERSYPAPYKCGCEKCNCGVVGLAPGKCGCGHPLVKNP